MADATCSVTEDGTRCPRSAIARGWCQKHYVRWKRTGNPLTVRTRTGKYTPCEVVEHGVKCEKRSVSNGMCRMHYSRYQRHGDPLMTMRRTTSGDLTKGFWTLVDRAGGSEACWLWQGTISVHGYGMWHHSPAHRVSYREANGEVPEGTVLDHTCHVLTDCAGGPTCLHRRCVNPAHLSPVDHAENVSAARSSNGWPTNALCSVDSCERPYIEIGLCSEHWQLQRRYGTPERPQKTHCKRGHPLSGPEADVRVENNGRRRCLHCHRLARRNRRTPGSTTFVPCSVDGCEKAHQAHGMCDVHYARHRRSRSSAL